MATSLDSKAEVLEQFPDAAAHIAQDPSAMYRVAHGIDATTLHKEEVIYPLLKLESLVLCWVFPFNGVEDDNPGNAQLIRSWFASIAHVCHFGGGGIDASNSGLAMLPSPPEVHVVLCGDQFSRWRVEAAARDAFFSLHAIEPFKLADFDGYSPRRNREDEPFPVFKPTVYMFRFMPSPLLLQCTVRYQM